MSQLDRALALARNGFAVFPLQPGKKIPLAGSRGFIDSSTDKDSVAFLWEKNPDANVGIYPWGGRRFVVFDIEGSGKGNDRVRSKKLLGRKLGMTVDLSQTLVVETPSEGWHIWYEVPDDCKDVFKSGVNFVKGCDIRAEGGYVLAPGSVVDGREYKTVNRSNPMQIPEKVLAMIPKKRERVENAKVSTVDDDLDHNVERAKAFLLETDPAVAGDTGNNWTFATACKVKDFGVSEDGAYELMLQWNDDCEPPWELEELKTIIHNAYNHGKDKAGLDASDPQADFGDMIEPGTPDSANLRQLIDDNKTFTLNTLEELEARPAPTWLVKKIIPDTGFGLMIGAYSSYKSFLAIDLACSVATGVPWAGRATKPGRVVYVAGEGGHGMTKRFAAWFKRAGGQPENLRILGGGVPDFRNPEEVKALAATLEPFDPDLVIVDTIASVTPGSDENSGADMGQVLAGIDHIRQKTGAFVLGVHHLGKDASKGARGWSGLAARADVELLITNDATALEAHVQLSKSRDAEQWNAKEVFKGIRQDMGVDADGDVIDSLAFRHDDKAKPIDTDQVTSTKRAEAVEKILVGLDDTITTSSLAKEIVPKTVEGYDERDFGGIVSTIKTWLGRYAKTERGKMLTTVDGQQLRGGANEILWRMPTKEQTF